MPARSGIVAVAVVFAAALVGVGVANERAVKNASSALVRGQADLLHDQLRLALGRGDVESADLDEVRGAYADQALRYLAIGDANGTVRASSGTSAWPSFETGGRGVQLERAGDLARATYRRGLPPRLARRLGASPATLLVFEFEPHSINELERRARSGIAISALFGAFALGLALSYSRQVRRAEASQRAEAQSRRLAALGQMSAVLAHELRNPLASLKGHAQLLARGLDGAQRDKAHLVVGEAVRLEKLGNDLLTFVRTGELHRAPVDLASLLPDGIAAPHVVLDVDAERMRQVLANLVDNARAAGEPVEVNVADGDPVTISVRDHGAGIEDLARLFEPFYTTKTHGTGLGLAIAHKIVALHGGTLTAENASPGARFVVSLPEAQLVARILVADDEPGLRSFLSEVLTGDGHRVTVAKDGLEAAALADKQQFALVVTDLKMPGLDGMGLLRKLKREQPEVEVVLLTAHGDVATAVEAMRLGAFDFIQKPLADPDQLSLLCARALEQKTMKGEKSLRAEPTLPLTYGDPAMQKVEHALGKVARTNATVLLLGESGVGKEVAARELCRLSDRAGKAFVAVNCAAISDQLLESELFGHEKGAFTGATERHQGKLELAEGGTFFLDEIGELRMSLQAKLLRVVQERRVERVGGTRAIELDVRFVAATNRDLAAMVKAGTFREDLYHRVAVFPITIPPLRERPRDLVPLAEALLQTLARELGRRMTLDDASRAAIQARAWPGNVRELRNALERATILSEGSTLDAEHLREVGAPAASRGTLEELERAAIADALAQENGNRRKAAARLGIAERTLYDKLKRL